MIPHTQLRMFEVPVIVPPMFRPTDPSTSRDAANDTARRAPRHRRMAEEALRAAGPHGLTDFELADVTGVLKGTIGKRRQDLQIAGRVVPLLDSTGQQVRRLAPSGSKAGVWVHVDHAVLPAEANRPVEVPT